MKIVVIAKAPFNVTTIDNATKVEYSEGSYTVYVGTTSYTYSEQLYIVRIV